MKLTALSFLHSYCYFFPSIFTLRLQRCDCTIQAAQMAAEGLYLPGVCITAEPMYTAEHSPLSDMMFSTISLNHSLAQPLEVPLGNFRVYSSTQYFGRQKSEEILL